MILISTRTQWTDKNHSPPFKSHGANARECARTCVCAPQARPRSRTSSRRSSWPLLPDMSSGDQCFSTLGQLSGLARAEVAVQQCTTLCWGHQGTCGWAEWCEVKAHHKHQQGMGKEIKEDLDKSNFPGLAVNGMVRFSQKKLFQGLHSLLHPFIYPFITRLFLPLERRQERNVACVNSALRLGRTDIGRRD